MAISSKFRQCVENSSCEFYSEVKNARYSTAALHHLSEYRHETLPCPSGAQCPQLKRLEKKGYQQSDIAHCAIYRHVRSHIGLTVEDNRNSSKFKAAFQQWERGVVSECRVDIDVGQPGDLVAELKRNGFEHVLRPTSRSLSSLNDIAEAKLQHPRHLRMGSPLSHDQMLAILLYTDTCVYQDLRSDEITFCNQNPFGWTRTWRRQKWPKFGALLDSAIRQLYQHDDEENHPSMVYHGLRDVKFDHGLLNNHGRGKREEFFKYGTFVSTTSDEEVALGFIGDGGCLLVIDTKSRRTETNRLVGADVSWISKFSNESEYLLARKPRFEISAVEVNPGKNYQIVRLHNGDNLTANSPP